MAINFPGWNSANIAERIHTWLELSGIILFGVVVLLELMAWQYGKRISELQKAETAQWQQTTNDRDKEIDKLRSQVTDYSDQIAAQTKLIQEQSDKLSANQPRRLTPYQKSEIAQSVSAFRGQKFSIVVLTGDMEALNYARGFTEALDSAGWDSGNHGAGQALFALNFDKVGVAINPQDVKSQHAPPAVTALIAKLHTMGLGDMKVLTVADIKSGEIQIYIGPHP